MPERNEDEEPQDPRPPPGEAHVFCSPLGVYDSQAHASLGQLCTYDITTTDDGDPAFSTENTGFMQLRLRDEMRLLGITYPVLLLSPFLSSPRAAEGGTEL